jgi:hypothetical protein
MKRLAELRVGVPVGREALGIASLDHEEDARPDATLPQGDQVREMAPAPESRRIRKKRDTSLHQRNRFDLQDTLRFPPREQEVRAIYSHGRLPAEDPVAVKAGDRMTLQRLGHQGIRQVGVSRYEAV